LTGDASGHWDRQLKRFTWLREKSFHFMTELRGDRVIRLWRRGIGAEAPCCNPVLPAIAGENGDNAMHAINRILGLIAISTAWASCGLAGAQNTIGAGQKSLAAPPVLGRRPVASANLPVPIGGGALRPTQQNNGAGHSHGNGQAPVNYLQSSKRAVAANTQPSLDDKRGADRRKKDEPNRAQLDKVKPKHEGHWRHDELTWRHGHIHDVEVVAIGRSYFATDSHWVGKRYGAGGERDVRLDAIKFAGNSFGGVLSQRTNGGEWDKMDVEGDVDGNSITFHTTRMLEGKNRHLNFNGYFSGNLIETDVSGRTASGTEASGSMTLRRR
jgi:hypothetical protein